MLGTSNEKITPSDSLRKGCAYLEVSHNLQNLSESDKETTSNGQGQCDNARGDETTHLPLQSRGRGLYLNGVDDHLS